MAATKKKNPFENEASESASDSSSADSKESDSKEIDSESPLAAWAKKKKA